MEIDYLNPKSFAAEISAHIFVSICVVFLFVRMGVLTHQLPTSILLILSYAIFPSLGIPQMFRLRRKLIDSKSDEARLSLRKSRQLFGIINLIFLAGLGLGIAYLRH